MPYMPRDGLLQKSVRRHVPHPHWKLGKREEVMVYLNREWNPALYVPISCQEAVAVYCDSASGGEKGFPEPYRYALGSAEKPCFGA